MFDWDLKRSELLGMRTRDNFDKGMSSTMSVLKQEKTLTERLNLEKIPTLPTSTLNIISLVFDENVAIEKLVEVIGMDVSLTSEIIKTANSPFYKVNEEVESINTAVMNLGLDTIKKIVLSTSVLGAMQDILPSALIDNLLTYSLATASAAQLLAQYTGQAKPEFSFLNGLLLNLGQFACASLFPEDFKRIYVESHEKSIHWNTVLAESLDINIGQLTERVAKTWNLPEPIINNISAATKLDIKDEQSITSATSLVKILYLSQIVADIYWTDASVLHIEKFKTSIAILLKKDGDAAISILNLLSEEFNNFTETLSLSVPKQMTFAEVQQKANQELLKINELHEQMYRELKIKNQELVKLTEEVKQKNSLLKKLVAVDPLTSLYNRRYFEKQLDRFYSEAKQYGNPLSLIMFDLDHFKSINDTYGHQAGDMVLKAVAELLLKTMRESDVCARYGGEEFIVILPQTDISQTFQTAERVRKDIEALQIPLSNSDKSIIVTSSFGILSYDRNIKNPSEFISLCDKNLYKAKSEGRNRVEPQSI